MNVLWELIFPRKCMLCRRVLEYRETDLCLGCRTGTRTWEDSKRKFRFLDSVTALWYYEENVRGAILRYKFYRARHLAPGFGRLLAMAVEERSLEFDVLTWVPVSARRKLTRGYDQSELLSKAAGRELGVTPIRTLKKIRNNPRQSALVTAEQRKANVLGVYRVCDPDEIRGKRVLLIDDVLTTGATAGECARMLLTAGAKEVHCAVLAAARKEKGV